jgi:hypothetical protein
MAGNYRSGRRPKATTTGPHEGPVKPSGLRSDASELWDETIAPAKHLSTQDTPLCVLACDLFVLLQDSLAMAKSDPVDKDLRIAATTYAERFSRVLSQLSVDPLGRVRIKPDVDGREEDPLKEFGIVG